MRGVRILVAAVLALLTVLVAPDRAPAHERQAGPAPDATLYEVTENIQFDPVDGVTFRDAVATLMGRARLGTPACPIELVSLPQTEACTVTGVGRDSVSLVTGAGRRPLSGTFAVVVNAPGNSSVHVPDLPKLSGTFEGEIDLSPAVRSGIPLGFVRQGRFTIDQTGEVLAFTGTFRLPFALDRHGRMKKHEREEEPAFYLGDDGQLIRVQPNERALGFPTVRLEIHFEP